MSNWGYLEAFKNYKYPISQSAVFKYRHDLVDFDHFIAGLFGAEMMNIKSTIARHILATQDSSAFDYSGGELDMIDFELLVTARGHCRYTQLDPNYAKRFLDSTEFFYSKELRDDLSILPPFYIFCKKFFNDIRLPRSTYLSIRVFLQNIVNSYQQGIKKNSSTKKNHAHHAK